MPGALVSLKLTLLVSGDTEDALGSIKVTLASDSKLTMPLAWSLAKMVRVAEKDFYYF
jgi:hypothetical protein